MDPFYLVSFPITKEQCQAINVGFELYIGIELKLSISIIGYDLVMGEFCYIDLDLDMIFIPKIL